MGSLKGPCSSALRREQASCEKNEQFSHCISNVSTYINFVQKNSHRRDLIAGDGTNRVHGWSYSSLLLHAGDNAACSLRVVRLVLPNNGADKKS